MAFVVCHAVGIEAVGAAADYIHLYQGKKETLLESLQRIRQAAAKIVKAITAEDTTRDTGPSVAGEGLNSPADVA